ncbi:MAG: hypothetical protein IT281_07215 [Ignavibacteria bacterium]|nr:hypothetical protein [Ignavibacteria bacterium]
MKKLISQPMKKIKINSVSNLQMQIQVQELHLQAFNWLKKHLHKLYTAKPLTRHDAMCPMSVESDPIGKRKVRPEGAPSEQACSYKP